MGGWTGDLAVAWRASITAVQGSSHCFGGPDSTLRMGGNARPSSDDLPSSSCSCEPRNGLGGPFPYLELALSERRSLAGLVAVWEAFMLFANGDLQLDAKLWEHWDWAAAPRPSSAPVATSITCAQGEPYWELSCPTSSLRLTNCDSRSFMISLLNRWRSSAGTPVTARSASRATSLT